MSGMRKPRENKHNRVYHLISRIAHRAFPLAPAEMRGSRDSVPRAIDTAALILLYYSAKNGENYD